MRKIVQIALVTAIILAQVPLTQADELQDTSGQYSRTCITTAYYSPLPDQGFYVTGSYEADKRLNGNGTNGADGTQVYIGMLAAPKSVPFGTKVYIPGVGLGVVHDRGGAIVQKKTDEGEEIDRLDVWAGRGEEGLSRALNWGKRTHNCIYFAPGTTVPAEYQTATLTLPAATPLPKMQRDPLSEKVWVDKLQAALKELGYYTGESTGVFDDETEEALIKFQVDADVIPHETAYGAGSYGQMTQVALEQHLKNSEQGILSPGQKKFLLGLKSGEEGEEVTLLQKALQKAGVFNYAFTNTFGSVTEEAVKQFQSKQGLNATGEVDSFTLDKLYEVVSGVLERVPEAIEAAVKVLFKKGDKSDGVMDLQGKLKQAGFLDIDYLTTLYGEQTQNAVYAFQLAQGLVKSWNDAGAGQYTDETAAALERFLKYSNDYIVLSEEEVPYVEHSSIMAETSQPVESIALSGAAPTASLTDEGHVFNTDLAFGDQGAEVKILQDRLRREGYYDYEGQYGFLTKLAVCEYQKDHGLLSDCAEAGAGNLDEETRVYLNQ